MFARLSAEEGNVNKYLVVKKKELKKKKLSYDSHKVEFGKNNTDYIGCSINGVTVRKIIITDLTRFSKREIVCVAGIDIESGGCIRPMPYLKFERCKELNMLPGAILTGEFVPTPNIVSPHVEDMDYKKLSDHQLSWWFIRLRPQRALITARP